MIRSETRVKPQTKCLVSLYCLVSFKWHALILHGSYQVQYCVRVESLRKPPCLIPIGVYAGKVFRRGSINNLLPCGVMWGVCVSVLSTTNTNNKESFTLPEGKRSLDTHFFSLLYIYGGSVSPLLEPNYFIITNICSSSSSSSSSSSRLLGSNPPANPKFGRLLTWSQTDMLREAGALISLLIITSSLHGGEWIKKRPLKWICESIYRNIYKL